jgi:hypothetical protein
MQNVGIPVNDVGLIDTQGVYPGLHAESTLETFLQVSQGRLQMFIHSRGNVVQEDRGRLSREISPRIAYADVVAPGEPCDDVVDLALGRGKHEFEPVAPGLREPGAPHGRCILVAKGDIFVLPTV